MYFSIYSVFSVLLCITVGCGVLKDKASDISSAEKNWEQEATDQQQDKCTEEHGLFTNVNVGSCSGGQTAVVAGNENQMQPCLSGDQAEYEAQCVQHDSNGLIYFDDGPSIPYEFLNSGQDLGEGTSILNWRGFFWDAGVNHDYCYHNGAATYNYAQADCDKQILDDLVALCSQQRASLPSWFSKDTCSTNAQIVYSAVRLAGSASFQKMSTRVHYPAYKPMWQTLGFSQEPNDSALLGAIEQSQ